MSPALNAMGADATGCAGSLAPRFGRSVRFTRGWRQLLRLIPAPISGSHSDERQRLLLLSQAMDQCGECVLISNRQGVIEYVNPAFSRVTGYLPAEVLGRNPSILSSSLNDRAFYRGMWECILAGKVWRGEVIDRRKDDTLYHAEMSISPVRDVAGRITHFISMQRDVSELRRIERELLHARKIESIGLLAGGLAHDLNNMFSVILGNIELAARDVGDAAGEGDNAVGRLRLAKQQVLRASALIGELMSFARKDKAVLQPVNLCELLDRAALIHLLPPQQRHVRVQLPQDDMLAMADELLLGRAIGNLLRNAFDAMDNRRSPELVLSLSRTIAGEAPDLRTKGIDPLGEWLCIGVADNGCGIAAANLEKIFDPFFTTKEVGKGTGLGLASVYGLMQSHGGHVTVESKPGEGTIFRLYFPPAFGCLR